MKHLLIIIYITFFPFNFLYANQELENYKRDVEIKFSKMNIKEIVIYRILNNTYNKYCKEHKYYANFEVVQEIFLEELFKRDDEVFSNKWHGQYNAHKRFFKKYRNKVSNKKYCDCVSLNIFIGGEEGQKCLSQ